MVFKEDIIQKIRSDFKDSSGKAIELLQENISRKEYLKTDRVIRCILYLASGDLAKLKEYIEVAIYDTRDVMYWAEYINRDPGQKPRRIRDFNKTFTNCENDVRE